MIKPPHYESGSLSRNRYESYSINFLPLFEAQASYPQHSRKQPTIAQAGERHGTVLDGLGRKQISGASAGKPYNGRRSERQPWKNNTRVHALKKIKIQVVVMK